MVGWEIMDFAILTENGIKLKGKQSVILIDSSSARAKVPADAILQLLQQNASEDQTLIIQGPGEYETKGTKITGTRTDKDMWYEIVMEGVDILIGRATTITRAKDKLRDFDVALIYADDVISQQALGVISPSVFITYGEKAKETITSLGKENGEVNKYTTTKDKLPSEMEIVLLA